MSKLFQINQSLLVGLPIFTFADLGVDLDEVAVLFSLASESILRYEGVVWNYNVIYLGGVNVGFHFTEFA